MLKLILCFLKNIANETAIEEISKFDGPLISSRTIVAWYKTFREILFNYFEITNPIQKMGGPQSIVEIDEAKIGSRKYNRGRLKEGN